MRSTLLCCNLLLFSCFSHAQEKELVFSYWSEASPPFVLLDDAGSNNVESGIIKDLAKILSDKLQISPPRFVNIPVARTESKLQSGEIDINCITNPIWKETPSKYYWSPVLFTGADRLLVKSSKKNEFLKFEDLKGKSLGIYNGYTYHSEIMKMIENSEINAVKVSGIDHGVQLLLLDRLDALIDFDILLSYKIKKDETDSLALADLYAERYDLYCAYSKKMSIDRVAVDQALLDIISSGQLEDILNRYQ